jgi:hypothetical protein
MSYLANNLIVKQYYAKTLRSIVRVGDYIIHWSRRVGENIIHWSH